MLLNIGLAQLCFFIFFFILEFLFPNRSQSQSKNWGWWWIAICIFSLIWLRTIVYYWVDVPSLQIIPLNYNDPVIIYIAYSFGGYWYHRFRHTNKFLWKYVHNMHHSAKHMDSRVAFFRHPIEMILNTIYLILIGKVIFNISSDIMLVILTIEGCLEVFHHSNIKWPKKLDWVGYFIQTPPMHLVHHQKGLHAYNYATITLWDTLFNTVNIPQKTNIELGFNYSDQTLSILMLGLGRESKSKQ